MAGEWMRDEDTADFSEVRRRLIERRHALGLSQAALAERLGTTQSAVSDLERGTGAPMAVTVRRWAAALGFRLSVRWELRGD